MSKPYQQAQQARQKALDRYLSTSVIGHRRRSDTAVILIAGTTHAIAIVFGMWLFAKMWGV